MKRLILTALLIVTANTVAPTSLSIKHNKKLPTPYELITKGTILHTYTEDDGDPVYYIARDKTYDLYTCGDMVIATNCLLYNMIFCKSLFIRIHYFNFNKTHLPLRGVYYIVTDPYISAICISCFYF